MVRRKAVLAITLIIVIISIVFWVVIDSNKFKSMDTTNINEITIHSPGEYFTITEQDDIQLLFNVLQSMKLRRILNSDKDGFAFLIDINLESDQIINMSILSGDINIEGRNYQPDKDYCDTIREIFNNLSEKYIKNPA